MWYTKQRSTLSASDRQFSAKPPLTNFVALTTNRFVFNVHQFIMLLTIWFGHRSLHETIKF